MRLRQPELAIIGAAALWGTTGTAQDLADIGASPVVVGVARIVVGGVALGAVAGWQGGPRGHGPRAPLVAGALAVAAYQACFFSAVDRVGVAVGTLVAIGSAPVFTGIVAFASGGERPARRWYPATGMAVVGCALLLAPGGDSDLDRAGLLLALGAGLAYAVYTVAAKVVLDAGVPGSRVMATMFLGGALILSPALLVADTSGLLSRRGLIMILWLGLVATALAYLLFSIGLRRLRTSTVATLSLTEPLTAALLGVLVLDERLGGLAEIGAAVLLAGLVVMIDRDQACSDR
jgi:drug/metabolite transporter, DME family